MTKTVVLLCGWMGAKPRTVDKYAGIYRAMGFETFVLLSTPSDFFKSPNTVHRSSFESFRSWLSTVVPSSASDQSVAIVPHIFSNGGARSWVCFQHHLPNLGLNHTVPAMVLDSTPTKPREYASTDAAFTATIQNTIVRAVLTTLLGLCMRVFECIAMSLGRQHPIDVNYERIIEQGAGIPKLFLYSAADRIVPANQIEFAVATVKSLGTPAIAVDFETSGHVAHYTVDPERYVKSIREFVAHFVVGGKAAL
ncbi:hypothetical protein H310_11461 [Aphanomyces invadans]|uniref:Uncharacterized protein n=1 Tax=Aphanomyces invadans TaxID=157072 RepID=A0A024TMH2_9STRA|nr:hypothetical protein H310_11461 [Aphanomyces invadans]ETV95204.1 hypothetical protein H310_11461 [Aphanomyces invadans]|eukprot:XP_008876377.1 hypothetical protein H310_11461 [Aphanomyces invadans]